MPWRPITPEIVALAGGAPVAVLAVLLVVEVLLVLVTVPFTFRILPSIPMLTGDWALIY